MLLLLRTARDRLAVATTLGGKRDEEAVGESPGHRRESPCSRVQ